MESESAVAATRAVAPSRARRAALATGVRITATDIELLALLARYTVVTVPMLIRHVAFCSHRSAVYRRIARLVAAGYVEDLRAGPANRVRLASMTALVKATKAGYALSGTGLRPVKRVSPGTLEHTLVVAEVGLMLESRGRRVLTDREIRSQIARWRTHRDQVVARDAPWIHMGASDVAGQARRRGRPTTHAPDLVYWTERGMVAVEVEWSLKSDLALEDVVRAFGSTNKYAKVLYIVPSEAIRKKFAKAMRSVPSHERPSRDLFHFQLFVTRHSIYPDMAKPSRPARPGLPTKRPDAA